VQALVTAAENRRDRRQRPPAGTWLASADRMISEPAGASRRAAGRRRCWRIVGAEGIGADEFGKPSVRCASVILTGASRAGPRECPHWRSARRLPTGKATANHMDGVSLGVLEIMAQG